MTEIVYAIKCANLLMCCKTSKDMQVVQVFLSIAQLQAKRGLLVSLRSNIGS